MSYPNSGAIKDELSNLFGVKPESISDLMDDIINLNFYKSYTL